MRVFLGISPSKEARAALEGAAARLCAVAPGRYVSAKNYHITLVFIGEVGRRDIAGLQPIVERLAEGSAAPRLTLGGLGYFGKSGDAIAYCGLSDAANLPALSKSAKQALEGFPFDPKPFRAHITLARKVNLCDADLAQISVEASHWTAGELILYESRRERDGLHYVPLLRAPFKK